MLSFFNELAVVPGINGPTDDLVNMFHNTEVHWWSTMNRCKTYIRGIKLCTFSYQIRRTRDKMRVSGAWYEIFSKCD